MTTAMKTDENSRISDLCDEPVHRLLAPIKGYDDKPLLPLTETVQPICSFFNEIEDYIFVALHNCQNPADGLDQQESAALHLYTMQFHGGPSLYFLLNQSLRTENRQQLVPWFSFLKLFLTALYKLPSQSRTVWRGVKNVDLSAKYKKGSRFAWWGVSSCTTDIEVLEAEEFLGKTGERTIFSIESINGKSIANHSYFQNTEKEYILMPGSYFEVIGQLNPAPQLHIIQLKEIIPPVPLLKPPFSKTSNNNSSSLTYNSNTHFQSSSHITKQNTTPTLLSTESLLKSNRKWKRNGMTVAGGNGCGNQLNQFNHPYGICIDEHQTIYIADQKNHRIIGWNENATKGYIVAGENGEGNETNQLHHALDVILDPETQSFIIADQGNRRVMRASYDSQTDREVIISDIDPYGLAMDKYGSLYVSNWKKNEVRRWQRGDKEGTIVAGGYGKGDQLNQLSAPTYLFVDEDQSLYVSDTRNRRVMKWVKDAKEGIVVAGGNGEGESLRQLSYPYGVLVDQLGHIYVVDCSENRVMRWYEGAKEGTIVAGGNGRGQQASQLDGPIGLSFDREGNLYIADCGNHRIQRFFID